MLNKIIHINATSEFLNNPEKMNLINEMVSNAYYKIIKIKYSFDVLNEVFGFYTNKTVDEIIKEDKKNRANGHVLHPTYEKHLPLCWVIQAIWIGVANENISSGKARELTASAVELWNTNPEKFAKDLEKAEDKYFPNESYNT